MDTKEKIEFIKEIFDFNNKQIGDILRFSGNEVTNHIEKNKDIKYYDFLYDIASAVKETYGEVGKYSKTLLTDGTTLLDYMESKGDEIDLKDVFIYIEKAYELIHAEVLIELPNMDKYKTLLERNTLVI